MKKHASRKVAFVSSFIPRRCGIATFASDLISNISLSAGNDFEPLVVAMQSGDTLRYTEPVKFEIRKHVKNDYICAADYINFSHVDLVSIQHEYGLFGGSAGTYLNLLLRKVNSPVVTTMHTVLDEPDPDYYQATVDLCEASHKVIVMNERGIGMLRNTYGIDESKIELIPHGIPDLPFVDSSYYKHKFGMDGRKTILTFGLLSRNKGIEMMLDAMPEIVKVDPTVLYIVLGATHPSVVKHDGEEYRFSLQRKVKKLGLQEHVIFHNRYVNDKELHNFLCAADLYVTPYLNREQLTSGTLAFAVGTGKAVISTPYWAAEELLADDRGKLVTFGDSKKLSEAVIDILQNESNFYSFRRKAYDYGRSMTWKAIGETYWKLFTGKKLAIKAPTKTLPKMEKSVSMLEVPEPPLDHLKRMTDDTGLYQHAKFIIPDRNHGYCTDDNARAVIAMVKYFSQFGEPEAIKLFNTYLAFIYHSLREDGTVRNFMSYDKRWFENEPDHDALARTLWAFGAVIAKPPLPQYLSIIKDCFDKCVQHVPILSLRGKCYAIFGMADYLEQFPGASDIKRHVELAADSILNCYKMQSQADWQWFENILTYDNAVLPHALFAASRVLEDDKYSDAAEKTCNFLIKNTFTDNHFSPIGCKGWYPQGGKRAKFDQQPLEALSTVMMLSEAYDATGNVHYLRLQKKTFDWFLGDNDLHIPVYDFRTKGSGDGLEATGVNLNQGAESLLSFLLSLLCVVESYSTHPDHDHERAATAGSMAKNSDSKTVIQDFLAKTKQDESILEKLF